MLLFFLCIVMCSLPKRCAHSISCIICIRASQKRLWIEKIWNLKKNRNQNKITDRELGMLGIEKEKVLISVPNNIYLHLGKVSLICISTENVKSVYMVRNKSVLKWVIS